MCTVSVLLGRIWYLVSHQTVLYKHLGTAIQSWKDVLVFPDCSFSPVWIFSVPLRKRTLASQPPFLCLNIRMQTLSHESWRYALVCSVSSGRIWYLVCPCCRRLPTTGVCSDTVFTQPLSHSLTDWLAILFCACTVRPCDCHRKHKCEWLWSYEHSP